MFGRKKFLLEGIMPQQKKSKATKWFFIIFSFPFLALAIFWGYDSINTSINQRTQKEMTSKINERLGDEKWTFDDISEKNRDAIISTGMKFNEDKTELITYCYYVSFYEDGSINDFERTYTNSLYEYYEYKNSGVTWDEFKKRKIERIREEEKLAKDVPFQKEDN